MIYGGPRERGETNRSRKAYAHGAQREVDPMMSSFEVNNVSKTEKEQQTESFNLIFTDAEAKKIHCPHDDTLVVTLTLLGLNMHQILIDNGRLMNTLYKQTLDKMEIDNLTVR